MMLLIMGYCQEYNIHLFEMTRSQKNLENIHLGVFYERILMWEIKRKEIIVDIERIPNEDGSTSRNLMFDNSGTPHKFPREIYLTLDQLTDFELDRLLRNLKKINGLVIEFNPLISCLLKFNTNVSLLGSFSQAKALLLHLLKYVTKAPADLIASITILKDARIRMEQYPSQAEDSGTDERSALRYLQGITNMMVGASEYSACTVLYAILGYPAEIYSDSFWFVFLNDAINYVNRKSIEMEQINEENDYCFYPEKKKCKIIK